MDLSQDDLATERPLAQISNQSVFTGCTAPPTVQVGELAEHSCISEYFIF